MATTNVNFKIKNGLVVEGSTATVNGYQVLTETASDQYIINLIGGETLITSVDAADFTVNQGNLEIASGSDLARSGDITNAIDALTTNDIGEDPLQALNLYFTDARAKSSAMDILVNSNQSNISITYNNASDGLVITAENGVAGSTTDDLTEGINNLYFTNSRAQSAINASDPISYSQGYLGLNIETGGGLNTNQGYLAIDRTTVDTWYEASNAVSTHNNLTSGVHGVTGDVVGTTDTQDISSKRIIDTLNFSDGVTLANEAEIAVKAVTHEFEVKANDGDLHLITVAGAPNAGSNVNISSTYGDIILNPGGTAYYGSASAENEIATHSYVDNAVSGLSWKQAVNLLSNANVSDLTDTTLTIDGHSVDSNHTGYRILLTGQGDMSENGIYEVVNGAFPGTISLSRPADADAYTELIGAAVYVMEGTQYGSTSWVQGNHYLTDFTGQDWTQFSGQGSVTAGTGIVVDGLEVSVDFTVVAEVQDLTDGLALKQDSLTVGDGLDLTSGSLTVVPAEMIDKIITGVSGSSYGLVGNATYLEVDNTNGYNKEIDVNITALETKLDVDGYAKQSDISTAIDSLTTADIEEFPGVPGISQPGPLYYTDARVENVITASIAAGGDIATAIDTAVPDSTDDLSEGANNLYYTDSRARDAIVDALTNANKNNIEITANMAGILTITAENGVADSDTDDLGEGTTNLYFTDQRALDAVSGSNIQPLSIDINTYRKEEATQQVVASASTVTAHTFAGNKSVKYLVRTVGNVTGTLHSQITELLVTVDGNNNVAVTEYGTIYTSENPLSTATMDYSGGEYRLRVTTAISGAEVVAAATIMSWAD